MNYNECDTFALKRLNDIGVNSNSTLKWLFAFKFRVRKEDMKDPVVIVKQGLRILI